MRKKIDPNDVDLTLEQEAVLKAIAHLDGNLTVMIEIQAAILAALTQGNAKELAGDYKKRVEPAAKRRMKEIRSEMSQENIQRFDELQKPDF